MERSNSLLPARQAGCPVSLSNSPKNLKKYDDLGERTAGRCAVDALRPRIERDSKKIGTFHLFRLFGLLSMARPCAAGRRMGAVPPDILDRPEPVIARHRAGSPGISPAALENHSPRSQMCLVRAPLAVLAALRCRTASELRHAHLACWSILVEGPVVLQAEGEGRSPNGRGTAGAWRKT